MVVYLHHQTTTKTQKMQNYQVTIWSDLGEEVEFFTSLSKAKEFMKKNYDRYLRLDCSLFSLMKLEFKTQEDFDLGNTMNTQIMTRTTICKI